MRRRWTCKIIIQEIIQREVKGLSLSASRRNGVDTSLYQSATRIYGSWQKALLAAGIAPERAMPSEKWSSQKILYTIRRLAKRKRPMNIVEVSTHYSGLVPAARRVFGSWSKALAAAAIEPTKFCRPIPWSRERVIEAILTRALRNEPLGSRTTEPRALVDAARRIFGSWSAAKISAGVGTSSAESCPVTMLASHCGTKIINTPNDSPQLKTNQISMHLHRPGERWNTELLQASIRARLAGGQRLNAGAVHDQDKSLYSAATRYFGNWTNALIAAGLNPDDFWRHGRPPSARNGPDRGRGHR